MKQHDKIFAPRVRVGMMMHTKYTLFLYDDNDEPVLIDPGTQLIVASNPYTRIKEAEVGYNRTGKMKYTCFKVISRAGLKEMQWPGPAELDIGVYFEPGVIG